MFKQLTVLVALTLCCGASIAQEVSYRKNIAPLWQSKCVVCHGAQSPERADFLQDEKDFPAKAQGPRMATYERFIAFIAWPDAGALMRRLDNGKYPMAGGKPGNMYAYLESTEDERTKNLALVKAWVDDGVWNLNRWEPRGATPAITKQQRRRQRSTHFA